MRLSNLGAVVVYQPDYEPAKIRAPRVFRGYSSESISCWCVHCEYGYAGAGSDNPPHVASRHSRNNIYAPEKDVGGNFREVEYVCGEVG